MKIITLEIVNALRKMKAECKTDKAVAARLGISIAHVGRIFSGNTQYLYDTTWERIEPILAPYMSAGSQTGSIINSTIIGDNNHISGDALGAVIRKIMASEKLSDAEKLKFIAVINE